MTSEIDKRRALSRWVKKRRRRERNESEYAEVKNDVWTATVIKTRDDKQGSEVDSTSSQRT